MAENRLVIEARLIELQALRTTPAGVPVAECVLGHQSRQLEAGQWRDVSCELKAVAIGDLARVLAQAVPGVAIRAEGFIAARSLKRRAPELHLNAIEFLEGNNHGIW